MANTPTLSAFAAALLGLVAFGWTGEVSPQRDGLVSGCLDDACRGEIQGFRTHWISRTGKGELFVMVRSDCRVEAGEGCQARFVERTSSGVATRLDVQGEFRVVQSGKVVPDIEARNEVSANEVEVTRYTWVGDAYVKSESRQVFRVDGEECGTALECYEKARAARDGKDTGKALNILETVHRVSYI